MTCKYLRYALVLLLGVISLSAQSSRPPGVPGEMPPSAVGEEASKNDVLVSGFRISSDFDDNALNDNHNKQSNVVTILEPRMGWRFSRPRVEWTLDYRPGFSVSHPLPAYNSRSQLLDTGVRFRLNKRLELRLRDTFLESKNPFDRLHQPEFMTGFGILDRPNDSILSPTARRSSEQAGLDLTYALGAHTIVGTSGSFFTVRYSAAAGGLQSRQVPENTTSANGHAFYSHHLTRRTWIGFDYNVQNLISRGSRSRSLIHTVFYNQTMSLTPNMRVSVFAGPQHSFTRAENSIFIVGSETVSGSSWHWAGGATYDWSGPRASLRASVFRKMSDGGGVLGPVQLSGATLEFRRQLTQRWTADLIASYDYNQALTGAPRTLSYVSAAGGMSRMLSQNLSLDFRYWRVRQVGSGILATGYSADHNRVSTSLAYDFKFPLGR